jgi:hypothetical protein
VAGSFRARPSRVYPYYESGKEHYAAALSLKVLNPFAWDLKLELVLGCGLCCWGCPEPRIGSRSGSGSGSGSGNVSRRQGLEARDLALDRGLFRWSGRGSRWHPLL